METWLVIFSILSKMLNMESKQPAKKPQTQSPFLKQGDGNLVDYPVCG